MFQVKICGIRSLEGLTAVLAAKADAIGLNFYPRSKRYLNLDMAQSISAAAEGQLLRVGLFVNLPLEDLRLLTAQVPLDALQAHGDEDQAWFKAARKLDIPLIRAIRCPSSTAELTAEIAKVPPDGELYDALLIDGAATGSSPGQPIYGGSGALAHWQSIREIRSSLRIPLLLAGGLTPENVTDAVAFVHPSGVDVAGGVENASGGKDANKVQAFVSAAKSALERLQ